MTHSHAGYCSNKVEMSPETKLTSCALWHQTRRGRCPLAPRLPWPPQTPPATPPPAAPLEGPVLLGYPQTPVSCRPTGRHRWFGLDLTWDQYWNGFIIAHKYWMSIGKGHTDIIIANNSNPYVRNEIKAHAPWMFEQNITGIHFSLDQSGRLTWPLLELVWLKRSFKINATSWAIEAA